MQSVFLIKQATRPLVPWFLVLLSLERFVSLKFINKSCHWRKESYLGLILAILIFLILSSTANLYFFVDQANTITSIESTNETINETKVALTASCESSKYVKFTADIISATLGTTLPLIFMIVFEFMIVSKLIVKIKFFGKTAKKSIRTHQRENHFTFTMIVIGIIFILFRLPVGVCYIIKSMYTGINAQNPYTSAILELITGKAYEMSNFYYASFFLINFIFNSFFRRECFLIRSEFYGKSKAKFF